MPRVDNRSLPGRTVQSADRTQRCVHIDPVAATFPSVRIWYRCKGGYGSTVGDERKGHVCQCNQVTDPKLWRIGQQCDTTCDGYSTTPAEPPVQQLVVRKPVPVQPVPGGKEGEVTWAYGLTTVPKRRHTILPVTLESLRLAGFERPHLFVDGDDDGRGWATEFGLDVTCRGGKPTRTFGNWVLAAVELYVRWPNAARYAIFQDDFVTYRNLRQYLDGLTLPTDGYWNLYTFPQNEALANGRTGWYPSDQLGKGAVALVFGRDLLLKMLTHEHMRDRPMNAHRGHRSVDGGIVTAVKKLGGTEYVHGPTLVQHIGHESSMGNKRHPDAPGFLGRGFDATELSKT